MEKTQKVAEKSREYVPNPDIRLVLNGGQKILDSATVPVEWHFSSGLIAKKPGYIVIIDHEEPLESFAKGFGSARGHRYGFRVKDLVGYIQLHKSGRHHFIAMVFFGDADGSLERARHYLEKEHRSYSSSYSRSISWDDVKRGTDDERGAAVTAVEFEIPDELFARKPETGFGHFVWEWVNRWYSKPPVDECSYRKRKMFAFTFQPFLFLIGRLFAGILGSLYTLIGAPIVLFLGWRPVPFFENIRNAWADPDEFRMNLSRFERHRNWRVWEEEVYHPEYRPAKLIPLWAVPFIGFLELLGLAVVVLIVYKLLTTEILIIVAITAAVGGLATLTIAKIAARLNSREYKERKAEMERIAEEEKKRRGEQLEKAYLAYLNANASLSHVPLKVEIGDIIRKVDTVTRFRLSFWATKAKVCRPFAK